MAEDSDLELLAIEVGTLWPERRPPFVLAVSESGRRLFLAEDAPRELDAVFAALPHQAPAEQPGCIEPCEQILRDRYGDVETTSGPSYVIPPSTTAASAAEIVRSDSSDIERLTDANPGNWEHQEWRDLLTGSLGPWAMAVDGSRVISICHTPVHSERGAEAGVWTDPQFRRHGHAVAVTAAWLPLITASGRIAFYSAASWNSASQGVARRLGARPIGWLWKISPRTSTAPPR